MQFVIHHKCLNRIAEQHVCLRSSVCHYIAKSSYCAIVFSIYLLVKERFGVVRGEYIDTESVLKRKRCVHLIDRYLVTLRVCRNLAHNVRAVVRVCDRGYELGGEHIPTDKLGQRMEHIDTRNMHVSQEGEQVALKYYVMANVVLQQHVASESCAGGGAIIRDLRVKAFLKES